MYLLQVQMPGKRAWHLVSTGQNTFRSLGKAIEAYRLISAASTDDVRVRIWSTVAMHHVELDC